jgi:PAS domain S-box-containing protein
MGYKRKELTSPEFNFLSMIDPEFKPEVLANFKKHLKGEEVPSSEITIVTKKGQKIEAILTTKLIKYGGETAILGIVTDITERKLAEEELCKYRDQLEELVDQRTKQLQEINAELEAFVYSVSHDLQAPLRSMQGFAQLLLKDYGSKFDGEGRDYTKRIIESSKYMNNMIKNLLAYSRMSREEIKLMPVSLEKIIQEMIDQFEPKIEKVHAEIKIKPPLPSVKANRTILIEVLSNLILNAITFVPQDSKPIVKIWSDVQNDKVRIYIEDNGIGIAPQYQDKIFRIFERLHGIEQYPGTGIGLAIVKKGIERMGGSVGVESELGKGSKFWIELWKVRKRCEEEIGK